ncbi:hypothetical protein LTR85_000751 [Meristemomyces frigidus]|nr:hypothetical protein LTR85_000751 [Meristemomyces frigidus]
MPSIPFFGTDGGTAQYSPPNAYHGLDYAVNTPASSPIHPAFGITLDESLSRRGIGDAMSVNASAVLAVQQRHTIQVMASATSAVSITAAICALYWFCMMRRNFRRDLVLLLVIGDFWKSLWFVIFAAVTFSQGPVSTHSTFCQASGYLLQMGTEMCDVAIFFMSLHMLLQIFPPRNSFLGSDGLYRIRYGVMAGWILIPNLSASLAFLNHGSTGPAFQAAGAFCTLPIRPFWYRLALSWVPRYLNWIFVMGVAIRIYSHVGKEFQVFGHERDDSDSMAMPGESSIDRVAAQSLMARRKSMAAAGNIDVEKQASLASDESVAPDDVVVHRTRSSGLLKQSTPDSATSSRQPSAPDWSCTFGFSTEPLTGPRSAKSPPTSRRGSRQIGVGMAAEDFAPPPNIDPNRHRGSITTLNSVRSSNAPSTFEGAGGAPPLASIREDKRASGSRASTKLSGPHDTAAQLSRNRRRAIQRQLRLLFIYPIVYMILWTIPFAYHSMSYSDHYAQHPIFVLSAVNTFCQCFLGFADVSVFCWREKPWRHIPGSDGTFVGSFCFWRFCWGKEWTRRQSRAQSHFSDADAEKAEDERAQSQAGLLASLKKWSISLKGSSPRPSGTTSQVSVTPSSAHLRPAVTHKRQHSGGSDRKQAEVDLAHQRLAMERADWERNRRKFQERRTSAVSMNLAQQAGEQQVASPERKEWWDRRSSTDLFRDPVGEGKKGGDV